MEQNHGLSVAKETQPELELLPMVSSPSPRILAHSDSTVGQVKPARTETRGPLFVR